MLTVSLAPHIKSPLSTKGLMRDVLIALLPAMLVSIYMFGISAIIITSVAVCSCIFFEWIIQKYLLKVTPTICDLSAALTGVLLAFNLPSNLPIGMIILGALIAIGVGKMSFGGLGQNPFNPALVGRVFLLISFPVPMTTWPTPLLSRSLMPWSITNLSTGADALTGATPLAAMKEGVSSISTLDLLLGNVNGSLGEISAIALLIGGIYLLLRRVITWHIPISILVTTFAFTGILHLVGLSVTQSLHLLAGGLMLGAFFMATDYVTSPMTSKGQIIFGVGIAVITVVIRCFGGYPEGVSFAILIMNAIVPLINRYVKPTRFGVVKQ
ncbi:MAG: RnfABCDGE type electron transport complex subunit D [Bacteroidales bacterium]